MLTLMFLSDSLESKKRKQHEDDCTHFEAGFHYLVKNKRQTFLPKSKHMFKDLAWKNEVTHDENAVDRTNIFNGKFCWILLDTIQS